MDKRMGKVVKNERSRGPSEHSLGYLFDIFYRAKIAKARRKKLSTAISGITSTLLNTYGRKKRFSDN